MLSRFRREERCRVGGRLALGTVEGEKQFTVGRVDEARADERLRGNLAVMDIYAAQRMFGAVHASIASTSP